MVTMSSSSQMSSVSRPFRGPEPSRRMTLPAISTHPCPTASNASFTVSRFNKGAALTGLATRLGVPMDRVAVAGDSGNDLSMVDVAAVSVWLGNPARLEGRHAQCLGSIDAALAVLADTVAGWA